MKISIIPPIIYKILGIKNVSGVQINPATEEKQDVLIEISKTLQSILTTQERIASQSPRLSRSKEVNVAMDSFWSAFTTSVINANSNFSTGLTFSRLNENFHFSNMWANQLYRNIT